MAFFLPPIIILFLGEEGFAEEANKGSPSLFFFLHICKCKKYTNSFLQNFYFKKKVEICIGKKSVKIKIAEG